MTIKQWEQTKHLLLIMAFYGPLKCAIPKQPTTFSIDLIFPTKPFKTTLYINKSKMSN